MSSAKFQCVFPASQPLVPSSSASFFGSVLKYLRSSFGGRRGTVMNAVCFGASRLLSASSPKANSHFHFCDASMRAAPRKIVIVSAPLWSRTAVVSSC